MAPRQARGVSGVERAAAEEVKAWMARRGISQTELAGAPMLVFRNEKHGGVNVVHRREDGNVGWIDPRNVK